VGKRKKKKQEKKLPPDRIIELIIQAIMAITGLILLLIEILRT